MEHESEKIDLLVTDVGGVLVKTDEAIITCIQRVVSEKGIPYGSVEAIYNAFGVSIQDYIRAYLPLGYEERADECYRDFRRIYPSQVLHLLRPFEGVDETLEYLKSHDIHIAALSCMRQNEMEANLTLLKFQGFDAKFSLDDYGEDHKRPDPEGLLRLMKIFEARPETTIYVGDTPSDIQMAKNAKVISVAVTTGAVNKVLLKEENPDYLLDSFQDIPREVLPKLMDLSYKTRMSSP
jgi:phosphoglycolate phosphatase-like HAD superfamily hydrolase